MLASAIDRPGPHTPADYLEAIQAALASDRDLSEAVWIKDHSDQKIRDYLRAVEERIVRELRAKGHAV